MKIPPPPLSLSSFFFAFISPSSHRLWRSLHGFLQSLRCLCLHSSFFDLRVRLPLLDRRGPFVGTASFRRFSRSSAIPTKDSLSLVVPTCLSFLSSKSLGSQVVLHQPFFCSKLSRLSILSCRSLLSHTCDQPSSFPRRIDELVIEASRGRTSLHVPQDNRIINNPPSIRFSWRSTYDTKFIHMLLNFFFYRGIRVGCFARSLPWMLRSSIRQPST